jgi:hypothetical protein
MLFALGAASAVLDLVSSIATSKSSAAHVTTGLTQNAQGASLFDTLSSSAPAASTSTAGTTPPQSGALSPETLNALFAAHGQQGISGAATDRAASLKDLFSLIDGDGNGQISKSEFENALGAGGTNVAQADDVFSKMDTNGDGAISLDEMASALKGTGGHHGHHHAAGGAGDGGGGADALAQALDGSSSTITTNSDGSTTTTVTYADGSKVTLTTPPSQTASSGATSSYNFVERAIQRQAEALSTSAQLSLRA